MVFCHLTGSRYAVLGPPCNGAAVLTASLTSDYFHLVQVSYSANTPLLSDIEKFPLFYRTVPSYLSYQAAVASIMQYFNWQQVGVIHQEVPYFTVALETLNDYLSSRLQGAMVVASQGLNNYLQLERSSEARIFIVMAPANIAAATLCAAYHLEMTGSRYQWILLGNFEEDWWQQTMKRIPPSILRPKRSCSEQEMLQAVESTLILTHQLRSTRTGEVIQGGQTLEEFWSEFAIFFNAMEGEQFKVERASRVPSTYDAMWSIALALNKALAIESQNTSNTLPFSERLSAAMETLRFQGVSGQMVFNESEHSQIPPVTRISQMQNGSTVFVGIHNERDKILNLFGDNLLWQSASGPPRDRPKVVLETVSIYIIGIMLCIVSVGIVLCIAMAVINCYYRKHKVIKASSPYINMLIITGCFMGFTSVIFISVENIDAHLDVVPEAYHFLCNARPWLLSLGYTLAFGALFAKTWRIYCIFKNPWKKNRPLKDHVLIAIVGVLLGIDVVVLILWMIFDPLDLHPFILDSDDEGFTQKKYFVCIDATLLDINRTGFTVWVVIIMIIKGVLLIFGIFLVFQTGKIKAEFFQDARFTGMAIYGVAFCCAVGVPTALFLMYYFYDDSGYVIATTTITFCSYLILFTIFIPKIILLKKYKTKVPTAVLIGLNPSLKVRSRAQYIINKRDRQCASETKQNKNNLLVEGQAQGMESFSTVSILTSIDGSQANVPLCKDKDDTGIMGSWESAIEHETGHFHKLCETEIQFEDVSYIASVIVDNELDRAGKRTNGTISNERESSMTEEQQRTLMIMEDGKSGMHGSSPSPTLEASTSHFSIDYATTCVIEIHSDSTSDM